MNSIKLKDNMYLNVLPVVIPKEKELQLEAAVNQFLIFDRSGSMCGYLDDVVDAAVEYCNLLPDGSTVSVGYFSGTSQYNLSVPYVLKKEIDGVTTTINSYRHSLGLTNFIEILSKVSDTASKLKDKSSLFFFTDGCHNSGGSRRDIEAVLKEWSKYAVVSMFVGYGYIDRDMLSWMANITEGSFIHLNNFSNFKEVLKDFGVYVEDSAPSIPVTINTKEEVIPISLSGKSIIEYTIDNGTIKYKPAKKGYKGVYFITETPVYDISNEMDITAEKGIRALATIYSQKNDVLKAMDLLSCIGDKHLIQSLYNSISPDEFSEVETKIRKSVFTPKERFLEGKVDNFLPDPNAFCIMDAITILADDEDAKMYMQDPDFEYTRIGKKTEQQDGSFRKYDENQAVSFNNIVFNKERLNLNISTSTQATVELDPEKFKVNPFTKDDLVRLNIPYEYPVTAYRTYSIIADGRVQTKKLVMSDLSKETVSKLATIITMRKDGKYIVDFSTLPIINRTYVKMTSAKVLAENVWKEKVLSDQIAVYNYLKKKEEEATGQKSFVKDASLSDEANAFLLDHCYIKSGTYNPPVKTVSEDDEYEAYSFSIDIKGFSKASASEVIKKIAENKNITPREQIIKEAYDLYIKDSSFKEGDVITKYISKIKELTLELNKVRKFIQLAKFAIILGNKGKMDEFSSRDNMSLDLKVQSLTNDTLNVTFNFSIDKVTVKI